MALAETGTRGLLGATIGSASERDEGRLARRLLHLLGPGMLILLDRAFDGSAARLVQRALSSRPASPEELAEIRQWLDQLEGETK